MHWHCPFSGVIDIIYSGLASPDRRWSPLAAWPGYSIVVLKSSLLPDTLGCLFISVLYSSPPSFASLVRFPPSWPPFWLAAPPPQGPVAPGVDRLPA